MKKSERKRRFSWIDTVFTLTILALAIIGAMLTFQTLKNEAAPIPEKKKGTAPSPIVVDTIDSNYPGIKIVTETSE